MSHTVRTMRRYNDVLANVENFIEANYDKSVNINDFAAQAGVSRRQVQRVLENFGTSWREMLTKKRMEVASNALINSDKTVRIVAVSSGYKQPAQFAKAFRSIHGMSPSEYREKFKASVA